MSFQLLVIFLFICIIALQVITIRGMMVEFDYSRNMLNDILDKLWNRFNP